MGVKQNLAVSMGRRDELPNIELAKAIAKAENKEAVSELVLLLSDKDKNVQSDAIKTLYEAAELKPALLVPHFDKFLELLDSKNTRLIWGAMTVIEAITGHIPTSVFENLSKIVGAADKGSVIARDHVVGTLVKLASVKDYVIESKSLLLEQLLSCPVNQLPMYAEMILPIANSSSKTSLSKVLSGRLSDMDKESKRHRIEKVIKKLNAIK